MTKKLTDEIRLHIFKQNIGCEVLNESGNEFKLTCSALSTFKQRHFKSFSILKRPSSSITDEEAREIARLSGCVFSDEAEIYFSTPGFYGIWIKNDRGTKDRFIMWNQFSLAAYQYIHLIGCAMGFLDWSVEELVK
jgi:hypothetical protein